MSAGLRVRLYRRLRLASACACAAFVLAAPCAQAQPVPEYDLKAAFIYNFLLFAEWPPETQFEGGTLQLCIHPSSPMRTAIGALAGKPVKGHAVVVRAAGMMDGVRSCHVLVLDAMDKARWTALRKALAGAPVLTIADDVDIGYDGSMITLAIEQGRMAFDVDTSALSSARLSLSSKLLRLARHVR